MRDQRYVSSTMRDAEAGLVGKVRRRGPDRTPAGVPVHGWRVGNGRQRRHRHQVGPLGGRTGKLRGPTDAQGRPRLLMLSAGNINDATMAVGLLEKAKGRFERVIADGAMIAALSARRLQLGARRR